VQCDIDKRLRQHVQLDAGRIIKSLPDLGESLQSAAIDLSRDCTLDRVDLMLSRLKGAEACLVNLRKALLLTETG